MEKVFKFIRDIQEMFWVRLLTVFWFALLVVPFLLIGQTWGMVWFILTWPFSQMLKELYDTIGEAGYVGVVSVFHTFCLFLLLGFIGLRLGGGHNTRQNADDETQGGAGGFTAGA